MRLVLISDTHLPVRAKKLPEPVWEAVERADVVDGGVRGELDGPIRGAVTTEQPNVTCSCQFRSVIQ